MLLKKLNAEASKKCFFILVTYISLVNQLALMDFAIKRIPLHLTSGYVLTSLQDGWKNSNNIFNGVSCRYTRATQSIGI